MYKDIEPIPKLPELEKDVIKFWEKGDFVHKLKKLRKNKKEKVYYDGPITANGLPHYGHAITWILKDIYPRYWSMHNFYVERNMGFDTKGILVEYEVEKELKFTKKDDVKVFGEEKFIKLCRDFVNRYIGSIFEYEMKLGRWFDKSVTYSTADKTYVESMWWSLKKLYEMGLLYEGHKVVAYSTRAGCSLSTQEVAEGGYKEIEDPFVTVKFRLLDAKNTYFLAWTTTPWTLPGNLMLAVNKNLTYAYVEFENSVYILAKDRVDEIFKGKRFKVLKSVLGKDLAGTSYEQPFAFFEAKRSEGCFKVILSSHAKSDEGTGIVHLAPYGEEDFNIFIKLGLSLFDYLDESANFTNLVPAYEGLFYKEANPKIIEDLKAKDLLFDYGTILHRMPICYRTGTPLIYKPVRSWYIAVTKVKEKMLKENQKINWFPEHLKNGASKMWIQNARDWALSRSRYWGTPMPLWVNDKTGEKVFIGSFSDIKKVSGTEVDDPHRPYVDNITWKDEVNGGTFRRVTDVLDVWYDSACMPFAQIHYPFENKDRLKKIMPAEYIAEGPDQVRLWFYVMHAVGVALFKAVPYKSVVTIGMMLDETGKKMSKSKRNYKPMDEVLNEYGADSLRYYILTSPIVSGQDAIFSVDLLRDAIKEFFLPLWNSLRYFVTYAKIYNFKPSKKAKLPTNVLDKWVLVRLQELINNVSKNMENYKIMEASRELPAFVSDLSTWYIRRSRDRIKENDKGSLETLNKVLSDFCLAIAPFLPFLSETIYRVLGLSDTLGLESVHLALYPKARKLSPSETKLLNDMKVVMQIVEKGHSERKASNIKVRQPLGKIEVSSNRAALSIALIEVIKDELNVKAVKFKSSKSADVKVSLDTKITKELEQEGLARDLVRSIQALRKEKGTTLTEFVSVEYEDSKEINEVILKFGEYIKSKANVKELKPGSTLKLL